MLWTYLYPSPGEAEKWRVPGVYWPDIRVYWASPRVRKRLYLKKARWMTLEEHHMWWEIFLPIFFFYLEKLTTARKSSPDFQPSSTSIVTSPKTDLVRAAWWPPLCSVSSRQMLLTEQPRSTRSNETQSDNEKARSSEYLLLLFLV